MEKQQPSEPEQVSKPQNNLLEADGYEEIETGKWMPDEEYETLEGIITGREEGEDDDPYLFEIETLDGTVRQVQYSTLEDDLNAAMRKHEKPQVKIIYTGEKQGTQYSYKTFKTGSKEAEAR